MTWSSGPVLATNESLEQKVWKNKGIAKTDERSRSATFNLMMNCPTLGWGPALLLLHATLLLRKTGGCGRQRPGVSSAERSPENTVKNVVNFSCEIFVLDSFVYLIH